MRSLCWIYLSPGPGIINGDVVFGRATPLVIGKSRIVWGDCYENLRYWEMLLKG